MISTNDLTKKTLLHHLLAFRAGDVDAILSDYTDDAILITPTGMVKGHDQIRTMLTRFFTDMFPPGSTSFKLSQQVIEGEIAYVLWSASSARYDAPLGTDTFVVRDGKIVAQTFAAKLEPKNSA